MFIGVVNSLGINESSHLSTKEEEQLIDLGNQGRTQGGLGLTPVLSLICYKNFITCAKEINCFRIRLLVNLST